MTPGTRYKATGNSKTKIIKAFVSIWLVSTFLLATGAAEGQQPAKIPRIGYVSGGNPTIPLRPHSGKR